MTQETGRSRVRRWRAKHGISAATLASRIGYVTHTQLAKWESDPSYALPIVKVCMLARIIGIPATELADADQLEELRELKGALDADRAKS